MRRSNSGERGRVISTSGQRYLINWYYTYLSVRYAPLVLSSDVYCRKHLTIINIPLVTLPAIHELLRLPSYLFFQGSSYSVYVLYIDHISVSSIVVSLCWTDQTKLYLDNANLRISVSTAWNWHRLILPFCREQMIVVITTIGFLILRNE